MKLWRKNRNVERELPSFLKAGLNRLNGHLISFAESLQRKTSNYSLRKKKILLFLFVIVFVTESIIVTVQSITRKNITPVDFARIKTIPVESNKESAPVITMAEFLRIQKFKNFIDSLSATAEGKKRKDCLLLSRPQLMDSVNLLINLFLEQSKTLVK